MNFLHYPMNLDRGEKVEVTLDKQAHMRLMDDGNFAKHRNGERHSYHGGLAKVSPVTIVAPRAGSWHLVIDLGGYAGTVGASVTTKKVGNEQRESALASAA